MHFTASRRWLAFAWLAPFITAAGAAFAAGDPPSADDMFVAGGRVRIDQPVPGDLIVAGGQVEVTAPVHGDLVVAGGNVHLAADVGASVFAAAGHLVVDGPIQRNLRALGGQVELGPNASVGRNMAAMGGQVAAHGRVGGTLHGSAGHLLLDGPVAGDVVVRGDEVELGPRAHVGGALRIGSPKPLNRSPAAVVEHGVQTLAVPAHDVGRPAGVTRFVWPLGLLLLAWLLLAAVPDLTRRTSANVAHRTGRSAALGAGWMAGVPVAIVVLLATIIGIPMALLCLALYLALWPVAVVVAAIGLGDVLLARWFPGQTTRLWARWTGAAASLAGLSALQFIPPLGAVAGLAACLVGAGGLLGLWVKDREASGPVAQVAAVAP